MSDRPSDESPRLRNVVALASRIAGAALQVAVVVVVGRTMGAAVLGQYLVFQSIVRVAGTALGWGHPWFVLRSVAELDELQQPDRARGTFRSSLRAQVWTLAPLLAATPAAAGIVAARGGSPAACAVVVAAALAAAGFAGTAIGVHGLKARQLQPSALFLEFSITPLAVIAIAGAWELLDRPAGLVALAAAHAASSLVGAAISVGLFERDHRARARSAARHAAGEHRVDLDVQAAALASRSRLSFGLTNLVNVIGQNAPPLVLPIVLSLEEVGRIGAAVRLTAIPGTLAVGLASVFAPQFAKLWVSGDRQRLRAVLRETQVWMTGLYLPFAVVLIVFPGAVSDALGTDFEGTSIALRLLGLGQLANAITGQAPMLLSMCRDEFYAFVNTAIGVVTGVCLSLIGGALWGVGGAAAGLAFAQVVRNILIWQRAQRVVLRRPPTEVRDAIGSPS